MLRYIVWLAAAAVGLALTFVLSHGGERVHAVTPAAIDFSTMERQFGVTEAGVDAERPGLSALSDGGPGRVGSGAKLDGSQSLASAETQVPTLPPSSASQAAVESVLERPSPRTPGAPDARDRRELERRARWSAGYATTPLEGLVQRHQELTKKLGVTINTEARTRFEEGDGQPLQPEEHADAGYDRWGQMVRYVNAVDGRKLRIVLREERYPRLYDMKREIDWLYGEVRRRRIRGS